MARMVLDNTSAVLTKESMESIRFVQNVSNSLLMLPDLGKKGVALHPDEIADLTKSFSKKDIGGSQNLAWAIREGHISVLTYTEENGVITLDGVKEDRDRFKPAGAEIPKNVPVEDRKPNGFDDKYDELEDKEQAEADESKPGRRRNRDRSEKEDQD